MRAGLEEVENCSANLPLWRLLLPLALILGLQRELRRS